MLKPGCLVFVRGELMSPIDDAIKTGEWLLNKHPWASQYTHVCVYLGNNTVAEAQGFRKSGWSNIGDYSGDYDIGHILMSPDQRKRFLAVLEEENGLPYDWLGIFWLIVYILTFKRYNHKYHEHGRRYCSKYVGWAARRAGIPLNDRTPEDLALDPHVILEKG